MTPALLAAWLCALPPQHDGLHRPIPRPAGFCLVAATAALERPELEPRYAAAVLDVLGAHESAYRPSAVGDSGRSVGAFQTPALATPRGSLGQARLALAIWIRAAQSCPSHAAYAYASGRCVRTPIAAYYERLIAAETTPAMVDASR